MTPTIHPLTYHCPHCHAAVEAMPTNADEAVVCPACQQAFKLELPVARAEPSAPAAIPVAGAEAPAPSPTALTVSQTAAEQPETTTAIIRVSMTRRYPLRCLSYATALIATLVGSVWLLVADWPILAGIVAVVLAYVAVRALGWWLRMHFTTLRITNRRCVIETGVLSREATEFGRHDIVDVQVSQDPVMRILDVGDLVIVSNAGARKEVVLMAVPHPEAVVQMITVPPPLATAPAAPEATSAA